MQHVDELLSNLRASCDVEQAAGVAVACRHIFLNLQPACTLGCLATVHTSSCRGVPAEQVRLVV